MKLTLLTSACVLLAGLAHTTHAQEAEAPRKDRIGIATPDVNAGVGDAAVVDGSTNALRQILEGFDGQLIDAFNRTRKFTVVGRSDLPDILKEQDFVAGGLVNPTDEQAARMFELAGCRYMVKVTIDSFQDIPESLNLEGRRRQLSKRTIQVGAVVKIYHTTTAELFDSYNDVIEIIEVRESLPGVRSRGDTLNRNLRDAVAAFSDRAAAYVTGMVFPAQVAAVRGGTVFVNLGEGSGVEVGQVWTVFFVGEAIRDPRTGEVLGQEELPLGDVRITRVLPRLSHAVSVDGSDPGFEAGMILRPTQASDAARTPAD